MGIYFDIQTLSIGVTSTFDLLDPKLIPDQVPQDHHVYQSW